MVFLRDVEDNLSGGVFSSKTDAVVNPGKPQEEHLVNLAG